MQLVLTEHPDGVADAPALSVTYQLETNQARFGPGGTSGHSLVFSLGEPPDGVVLLAEELHTAPKGEALMRCDRIDFPPRGEAHLHTHPGPGIRCQLFGELSVTKGGATGTYRSLQPWFESGPDPVYAIAGSEPAAFVRVLVLPPEWEGKRTIRYVDPADESKPKLQTATVFLEEKVTI